MPKVAYVALRRVTPWGGSVLRLILPIRLLGTEPRPDETDDALGHWVKVASSSLDPCLVLDEQFRVAGVSWAAAQLIGEPADGILGRNLVDDVLRVVDFTEAAGSGDAYARGIPPVAALRDNHLSRGLLRLLRPTGDRITLDAVAAPIHGERERVVGSITFFASL
ncbi:MAG: hypothetical protein ABIM89_18270 [Mycobacteriales bacterium]